MVLVQSSELGKDESGNGKRSRYKPQMVSSGDPSARARTLASEGSSNGLRSESEPANSKLKI